jgi:hypothetical protein
MASNQKRSFHESNGVSFDVPREVIAEFETGLENLEHAGDGLEQETIREAREIVRTGKVTVAKLLKMTRFWARNRRFLKGKHKSPMWTSSKLWGGNPGRKWAEKVLAQMKRANPKLESMMLGLMKANLSLVESLLVQDGVDRDALGVLEYAGFSGDGGEMYRIAALAALAAGGDGRPVQITMPSYRFEFREGMPISEAQRIVAMVFQFTDLRKEFNELLEHMTSRYDRSSRPQSKYHFDLVIRHTLTVGRYLSGGDQHVSVAMQAARDMISNTSRFQWEEGNRLLNRHHLNEGKRGRYSEGLISSYFRTGRNYMHDFGEQANTYINEAVQSTLNEAIDILFDELDIDSKVTIKEVENSDKILIKGSGGSFSEDAPSALDMEYIVRRPSGAPRALSKAPSISRYRVKILPSGWEEHSAQSFRSKALDGLKRAQIRALRKDGVRQTGFVRLGDDDIMNLVLNRDTGA